MESKEDIRESLERAARLKGVFRLRSGSIPLESSLLNLPKKEVTFKIKNESSWDLEKKVLKLRFSPTCRLRDFIFEELGFFDPLDRPVLRLETLKNYHIHCDYDELDDQGNYILKILNEDRMQTLPSTEYHFTQTLRKNSPEQILDVERTSNEREGNGYQTEIQTPEKRRFSEASTAGEEVEEEEERKKKRRSTTGLLFHKLRKCPRNQYILLPYPNPEDAWLEGYEAFKFPFIDRIDESKRLVELLKHDIPQVIVMGQESGTGRSNFVRKFRNAAITIPREIMNSPMIEINGYQIKPWVKSLGLDGAIRHCLFNIVTEVKDEGLTDGEKLVWLKAFLQRYVDVNHLKKWILFIEDIDALEENPPRASISGQPISEQARLEYLEKCWVMYRRVFQQISSYEYFHLICTGNSEALIFRDANRDFTPLWESGCSYQYRTLYLPPFSEYAIKYVIEISTLNDQRIAHLLSEKCGVNNIGLFAHDLFVLTLGFPGLAENLIRAMLTKGYRWSGDNEIWITSGYQKKRLTSLMEFCMEHKEIVFHYINVGQHRHTLLKEHCLKWIKDEAFPYFLLNGGVTTSKPWLNLYYVYKWNAEKMVAIDIPPLIVLNVLRDEPQILARIESKLENSLCGESKSSIT